MGSIATKYRAARNPGKNIAHAKNRRTSSISPTKMMARAKAGRSDSETLALTTEVVKSMMSDKNNMIIEELALTENDPACLDELQVRREEFESFIDQLLASVGMHAHSKLTTFTPWRYDIRRHFG
jgi:hypothetical protein